MALDYQSPQLKRIPVHVVTTIRDGTHPDGFVVSDVVLMPLTRDERMMGMRDKLAEWRSKHGRAKAPRVARETRWSEPARVPDPPKVEIDAHTQEVIWATMEHYYANVASRQIIDKGYARFDELEDLVLDMHIYVLRHYPGFDPNRPSSDPSKELTEDEKLDQYCRQQARDFAAEFKRRKDAAKRAGARNSLSLITVGRDDGNEHPYEIGEESIPGRRQEHEDLFDQELRDFMDEFFTPHERLALQMKCSGSSDQEIADLFGMALSTFRRRVLGHVQILVDCFLPPTHGTPRRKFICK